MCIIDFVVIGWTGITGLRLDSKRISKCHILELENLDWDIYLKKKTLFITDRLFVCLFIIVEHQINKEVTKKFDIAYFKISTFATIV